MAFYSFSPTIKTEKEVLQKDGVTLAVVNVALPSLSERDDAFAKSLNGLYTRISEGFLNYCRGFRRRKRCAAYQKIPQPAVCADLFQIPQYGGRTAWVRHCGCTVGGGSGKDQIFHKPLQHQQFDSDRRGSNGGGRGVLCRKLPKDPRVEVDYIRVFRKK